MNHLEGVRITTLPSGYMLATRVQEIVPLEDGSGFTLALLSLEDWLANVRRLQWFEPPPKPPKD